MPTLSEHLAFLELQGQPTPEALRALQNLDDDQMADLAACHGQPWDPAWRSRMAVATAPNPCPSPPASFNARMEAWVTRHATAVRWGIIGVGNAVYWHAWISQPEFLQQHWWQAWPPLLMTLCLPRVARWVTEPSRTATHPALEIKPQDG